jgi:hypothetical protein
MQLLWYKFFQQRPRFPQAHAALAPFRFRHTVRSEEMPQTSTPSSYAAQFVKSRQQLQYFLSISTTISGSITPRKLQKTPFSFTKAMFLSFYTVLSCEDRLSAAARRVRVGLPRRCCFVKKFLFL